MSSEALWRESQDLIPHKLSQRQRILKLARQGKTLTSAVLQASKYQPVTSIAAATTST